MKLPRLAKTGLAAVLPLAVFGVAGTTGGIRPGDDVSRGLIDEVRYRIEGREMHFTLTCLSEPSLRFAVARGRERPETVAFVEGRLPGCKVDDDEPGAQESR